MTISQEQFQDEIIDGLYVGGPDHWHFNGYDCLGYIGNSSRNYLTDEWVLKAANELGWSIDKLKVWVCHKEGRWALDSAPRSYEDMKKQMSDSRIAKTAEADYTKATPASYGSKTANPDTCAVCDKPIEPNGSYDLNPNSGVAEWIHDDDEANGDHNAVPKTASITAASEEMVCPNCGAFESVDGETTCPNCGFIGDNTEWHTAGLRVAAESLECLDDHDGGCQGTIEYRESLSGTGTPIPRCDKHWEKRLEEQDDINEKYAPDSDVPPLGYDYMDAGEYWSEEDY